MLLIVVLVNSEK